MSDPLPRLAAWLRERTASPPDPPPSEGAPYDLGGDLTWDTRVRRWTLALSLREIGADAGAGGSATAILGGAHAPGVDPAGEALAASGNGPAVLAAPHRQPSADPAR